MEREVELGMKARSVAAVVRIPLVLLAMGLPIFWMVTYSGVYRWLAELQLRAVGSYGLLATGVFTLLSTLAPAVGILVYWSNRKARP